MKCTSLLALSLVSENVTCVPRGADCDMCFFCAQRSPRLNGSWKQDSCADGAGGKAVISCRDLSRLRAWHAALGVEVARLHLP